MEVEDRHLVVRQLARRDLVFSVHIQGLQQLLVQVRAAPEHLIVDGS